MGLFGTLARASAIVLVAGLELAGIGQASAACAPGDLSCNTYTESSSYYSTYDYQYDGRRNDTYQTQITAIINGGPTLYDQTFLRRFADPIVQAGLAQAQPLTTTYGGRPGVLVFSQPELIDSSEDLLDLFTEVSIIDSPPRDEITIQTTSGDVPNNVVYAGFRGNCYSPAASGSTNTEPFDGHFPDACDSNDETYVDPGHLNTNTHTTTVVDTIELSFTNEDYLNFEHWQIAADIVPIGAVHPAVQSSLFDASSSFLNRLTVESEKGGGSDPMLAASADEPRLFRIWGEAYGGRWEREGDLQSAGNKRNTAGFASGLVFTPAESWSLGIGVDHAISHIDVIGAPENARTDLTLFGLHSGFNTQSWFANTAALYGSGNTGTMHGDTTLGGVSSGEYNLNITALSSEAGYRFSFEPLQIVPALGVDWVHARTSAFTETGATALMAQSHSSSRSKGWIGLGVGWGKRWDDGKSLELLARGRLVTVFSGLEDALPVAFAALPSDLMELVGAEEGRTGGELGLTTLVGFSENILLRLAFTGGSKQGVKYSQVTGGLHVAF